MLSLFDRNQVTNAADIAKAHGDALLADNPWMPKQQAHAPVELLKEYAATGIEAFKHAAGKAYDSILNAPLNAISAHVSADNTQIKPKKFTVSGRGADFLDSDISTIAGTLFGELSNKGTPADQMNEAHKILDTAINRAKATKKTLGEIFEQPNQYQAYKGKQYWMYLTGKNQGGLDAPSQEKADLVDKAVNQLFSENFKQDETGGKVFYAHNAKGEIVLRDGTLFKKDTKI